MATAWVSINDDVFWLLTDSTEKLRSFGVTIVEKGIRYTPEATWWRVEFDPTTADYRVEEGDILPLSYFVGEDGKLAVTGPGGTITEPA